MNHFYRKLTLAAIIWPVALMADTVFMRSGERVEGTVVSQTRLDIRIQTPAGVRTIEKVEIGRIVFASADGQKRAEAEEAARKAEEGRKAEEARRAEQARRTEEARRAEQQRRDETRRLEEARKVEQTKAEQTKRADDAARVEAALPRSRSSVLWRSAVFPGWGQLYGGRKTEGAVFAFGFGGSLLLAVASTQKARAAQASYRDAADRAFMASQIQAANSFIVFWSLLDARNAARARQVKASTQLLAATSLCVGIYATNLVRAGISFSPPPGQTAIGGIHGDITFSVRF